MNIAEKANKSSVLENRIFSGVARIPNGNKCARVWCCMSATVPQLVCQVNPIGVKISCFIFKTNLPTSSWKKHLGGVGTFCIPLSVIHSHQMISMPWSRIEHTVGLPTILSFFIYLFPKWLTFRTVPFAIMVNTFFLSKHSDTAKFYTYTLLAISF